MVRGGCFPYKVFKRLKDNQLYPLVISKLLINQPLQIWSFGNDALEKLWPKHKMIVTFWWWVLTTSLAPHKFPKKKLGRGEYIFIFDGSGGNFQRWGLCDELHWHIMAWHFHYVLQHDTNPSYSIRWGVDVTMIIQCFLL